MSAKSWLIKRLASESDINESEINCDDPFDDYDLDSLDSVSIFMDMESEFDLKDVDPSILSQYNTINKLSHWIESVK